MFQIGACQGVVGGGMFHGHVYVSGRVMPRYSGGWYVSMVMSMFQVGACQGVVGGGMFRFHGNFIYMCFMSMFMF